MTPEQRAPEKPRWGKPCNGCGFCCAAVRCPLAIELIGDGPAPCPAMEFEDGRFWCGLVRNASKHTEKVPPGTDAVVGFLLKPLFGTGCDSDDPEDSEVTL